MAPKLVRGPERAVGVEDAIAEQVAHVAEEERACFFCRRMPTANADSGLVCERAAHAASHAAISRRRHAAWPAPVLVMITHDVKRHRQSTGCAPRSPALYRHR